MSINEVFNIVRELLSKDDSGYFSNDEFNRRSKIAEQMLVRFYVNHFEEHGVIPDAMYPFNEIAALSLDSNSRFAVPSNFVRRNVLFYKKVTNAETPGDEPTVERINVGYLEKVELLETLDSSIRGPLYPTRMHYTFTANKAQVYPAMTGVVEFDYIRTPVYGVRAVDIDPDTLKEDYDVANTVDYEWPEHEMQNIVSLILVQFGIILRDSDVIQYAMAEQAKAQNFQKI